MGSYSVEDRVIRIHRSLDRSFVPRFFVEWIVFHEMLHQVHDIKVKNVPASSTRRRSSRTRRTSSTTARRAWERRHLDQLLTY